MLEKSIVKHIKQLKQKKFRKEFGEFLVEGFKGVGEAIDSDFEVVLVIIEGNRRDETEMKEIIKKAEKNGVPVEFSGRQDIGDIKTTDTFPGLMAVIAQNQVTPEDITGEKYIICLDSVKDPGNLGTIIRTADWFGIKNILLSEDCVDPYNEKVVRSTMGSIFHVNIFESAGLEHTLKTFKEKHEYKICSLVMKGEDLNKLKATKKTIFVLGSESHGVRKEVEKMSDKNYTIGGKGDAESLNVAIAGGILMNQL
ncbi:MAG: RNA methyltransferase [Candidatus Magasanikbacteria bacterium]|jgi:RNA methyltransferase, TrmH family|nr:RNA methyltransferase [Candidatus Magasanikbacteria bacterium]MBT4314709.1 RNA methyltransferase [Candidatus Magasanikbacteria bacterium]MBT4547486.1 RNA methyltransferase [Candidatus Magasanikbacteria bacterium]MBT6819589.1 RNA methyltransferase [Candidatus Magasanikbacteria bacterium]